MSLDRSLKAANALVRHRNVLTRDERLLKLKEEERWTEAKSVFGLPKVAHRKAAVGGGGKAEKDAAATGAAPTAAAGATAAAPAAKGGAAPAAGAATAKGGAPAKGAAAAPAAKGGAAPAATKKK